ncbi:MAG: phosphoribulokinase / uridine kinase family protein [Oscillospiraceae bacterium]|jgi:uridine kinase|nr:phosphoribulokinase / uridine kinase family protein [Oscillospiraceae bacterium]
MRNIITEKTKINIEEINNIAKKDAKKLVIDSEKQYLDQLSEIASFIKNSGKYKIILIAGPSASGKTTTSFKLREQLYLNDIKSVTISLDNFLFNRESLPLLEDGSIDFESIDTIDINCLHDCIDILMTKKKAQFPTFDFVEGKRSESTIEIEIDEDFVVIIEGIHALNPIISENKFKDSFLKIYVSVKSEYYNQDELTLPSKDLRLIRRMIRDYHFRGSSVGNTLSMWDNVCKGEELYIKPFQVEADFCVDSIHLYEPLIYHHYLLPLLKEIPQDSVYYRKCDQLVQIIARFNDLEKDVIPRNSMLREFIG